MMKSSKKRREGKQLLVLAVIVILGLVLFLGMNVWSQEAMSGDQHRTTHVRNRAIPNEIFINNLSTLVTRGEAMTLRLEGIVAAAEKATAELMKAKQASIVNSTTMKKANRASTHQKEVKELRRCVEVDRYEGSKKFLEVVCVAPEIQLARRLKVRLVPKGEKGGRRAFFLLSQGLRQHPMVELIGAYRLCADKEYTLDNKYSECESNVTQLGEQSPEADIAIFAIPANSPAFYSSRPHRMPVAFTPYRWETNKKLGAADPVVSIGKAIPDVHHPDENPTLFRYKPPVQRDRVIFVDEADWSAPMPGVEANDYLAYFKRSWVDKNRKGVPVRASRQRHMYPPNRYFPMPYALADEYLLPGHNSIGKPRPFNVVCSLRRQHGHDTGRNRVLDWLADHFQNDPSSRIGEVSHGSRTTIDSTYFGSMQKSKLVVTCNPFGWEGDFRLFEALSSGALVFVDAMATPYHHPLVDGKHLIYYDHTNRSDLLSKIDHALANPIWARSVAVAGFLHVLRHHRAVAWTDYFLRTADALLLQNKEQKSTYVETALDVLSDVGEAAVLPTSASLLDDSSQKSGYFQKNSFLNTRRGAKLHLKDRGAATLSAGDLPMDNT